MEVMLDAEVHPAIVNPGWPAHNNATMPHLLALALRCRQHPLLPHEGGADKGVAHDCSRARVVLRLSQAGQGEAGPSVERRAVSGGGGGVCSCDGI